MATKTTSGRSARVNAMLTTGAVLGILVLLNVAGLWVFGKIDLTDNKRYTLSDVSRQAVRDLDSVDVQVFISPDLPPTIAAGYGREREIRGVDREFQDKLDEYASYSGGNLRITVVREGVEDKAQKAKLEMFTGKEAQVEEGRLEFKKYALGATFQYRDQMEVYPLALEPEYFEFEITKILLRLKEKYEKSASLKDVLDTGNAVADAAKACSDKVNSYKTKGAEKGGLTALVAGGDLAASLRMDRAEFRKACNPVTAAVDKAKALAGRSESLDQLAESGKAFAELVGEIDKQVDDPKVQGPQIGLMAEKLGQIHAAVDKDRDTLKNSPGRKAIGFLCGHREFCPFPERKALIQAEIAAMMGQRNPLVQQFVSQAKQIEDQINQVNDQIRRGLFVRRGLTLKRIDAGDDIPDDVEVLVVYAPQKRLGDRDLYNIDQFLLSGRSVIFFVPGFDVAVYNIKKGGEGFDPSELTMDELDKEPYDTNVGEILATYGVKVNRDLVVEPKSFEPITIIQLQKQGQYTLQSQHEFPYPLLPTFSDLDRSHVLVRRLSTLTLPYASTLELTDAAAADPGLDRTHLVKTSTEATAVTGDLELSPPYLMKQLPMLEPNGPKTVAMVLRGDFQSHFKGRAIPPREEKKEQDDPDMPKPKPVDRPFRDHGTGRLLVIGSSLGLENLSPERVFEGFNMGQLQSGTADFFMKLKDYVANFQNWQLRLTQIGSVIQANLDFLFNCLDWGVQNEALVDIRSKGLVKRPIDPVSTTGRTVISLLLILGLPALFVGLGVVRFAVRRKKK
jgi:ABC-type uncharacterized transport system involved in gliding motility auxiliary subunit